LFSFSRERFFPYLRLLTKYSLFTFPSSLIVFLPKNSVKGLTENLAVFFIFFKRALFPDFKVFYQI